jgi:catechol 2,3-dioxygenase-like lactoylglutathione lyase family enzyme
MEGRPPVWIGHVVLPVDDVDSSADFWRRIGMREVERNPHVAVLELRGGTHLVLVPGDPPGEVDAPFRRHGRGSGRDPQRLEGTGAGPITHRARTNPRFFYRP